jgi:hypothetical protein
MNRYFRAFIAALIISIMCFIITGITFASGVWYGVFPLAFGLFFLLRYGIPAYKLYLEDKSIPANNSKPLTTQPTTPSLDMLMKDKYKLSNTQTVKVICGLISNITTQYNQKNNTKISDTRVAELFFHRLHEDVSEMTVEDLKNQHFGIYSIIVLCCNIAADNEYERLKEQVWKDLDVYLKNLCPDNTKEIFSSIMDDTYIDLTISHLEASGIGPEDMLNGDTSSLFDKPVRANEIVDETLARIQNLSENAL